MPKVSPSHRQQWNSGVAQDPTPEAERHPQRGLILGGGKGEMCKQKAKSKFYGKCNVSVSIFWEVVSV